MQACPLSRGGRARQALVTFWAMLRRAFIGHPPCRKFCTKPDTSVGNKKAFDPSWAVKEKESGPYENTWRSADDSVTCSVSLLGASDYVKWGAPWVLAGVLCAAWQYHDIQEAKKVSTSPHTCFILISGTVRGLIL